MSRWQQVEPGVWVFPDSCQVYALRGHAGAWIVVNAGTGAAASRLGEIGANGPVTVLLTHHFRDHTAGAAAFRAAGASIAAPEWERDHLSGDQRAFRTKATYVLYDVGWDQHAPITPLTIDRWMLDYERLTIAGLPVEVVPTPGATMGAVAYVITLPSGRRLAFVGEMMSAPGKLPRLSPFQYNYNDLVGGENVLLSWSRVVASRPDLAMPSLGAPFGDCPAAVEQLRSSLLLWEQLQPGFNERFRAKPETELEEIVPRLYRAKKASSETHFLIGRSGRVLALDYGYDTTGLRHPMRIEAWNRRTLLFGLEELRRLAGADRIDTVIPTHFHDDHVAGIPLLQRMFGTAAWVPENFADLLEKPQEFDRPCLWPQPARIGRRLPLGEKFFWEDVAITLHPMRGHTEFSALICLEFDGRRIAHTGDQLFFLDSKTNALTHPKAGGVFTNHVYRNGLALGCYVDFVRRLREFDPELVLNGHHLPYRPDAADWAKIEHSAKVFDEAHQRVLALGADDVHFGAEGQPAKLHPYRIALRGGEREAALRGWVLNPFPHAATAELRFAMPRPCWKAEAVTLPLAARARADFATNLSVPRDELPGRHPIALELTVDGRPFGQVTEAWVTVE